MKKPTAVQKFFANDWPLKIWLTFGAFAALFWAITACEPSWAILADRISLVVLVAIVIMSPVLGLFVAAILGAFFLPPIFRLMVHLNGGPFELGDTVQVISGPYSDHISQVYAFGQGDSICIHLDEGKNKAWNDTFSPWQVLKIKDAEQNP